MLKKFMCQSFSFVSAASDEEIRDMAIAWLVDCGATIEEAENTVAEDGEIVDAGYIKAYTTGKCLYFPCGDSFVAWRDNGEILGLVMIADYVGERKGVVEELTEGIVWDLDLRACCGDVCLASVCEGEMY